MSGDASAVVAMSFNLAKCLAQAPFGSALRLRAEHGCAGGVRATLSNTPAVRNAESGAICEGIIAASADQIGGAAVASHLGIAHPKATLTMDLAFPEQVFDERLTFDAKCVRWTGPLAHVQFEARADRGAVAALGFLTFALGRFPGAATSTPLPPVQDPTMLDGHPIEPLVGDNSEEALGIRRDADRIVLVPARNVIGSRVPLAIHGGVIAAALLIAARRTHPAASGLRTAAASIQFLRAGLVEPLHVLGVERSRSRRAALIDCDATQHDRTRHVAGSSIRLFELEPS